MTQSFGMFTPKGDELVAKIVDRARRNRFTWAMTLGALEQLARNHPDVAAEATDTEVREIVYNATGAYARGEDFWV